MSIVTRMRKGSAAAIAATGVLVLASSGARADSIDGDWCSPEGRHVSIKGPEVTTPGGAKMAGSYSRHASSYVTPASEPGAGAMVFMTLLNEMNVQVREGEAAAPIVWKRCQNIT